MTGLDKIISQIGADSADRCRNITEKAEKEAERILAEADGQIKNINDESAESLEKKIRDIKLSAESSAQLKRNQIVLKGKLEAIDDILAKALEIIKALPKKEYFEILKELIIKNALNGNGVLMLNAEDSKRLPQNFIDSVNSALKGKSVITPGGIVEIDSGFILVYGDIDINCTFPAIAAEKHDELRDALNNLLFN